MYTARLKVVGNDSLKGDKVRLPVEASRVIFSSDNIVFPLTFELKVPASRQAVYYALSQGLPRPQGLSTHCGVREFTSEPGTIEMPSFLIMNLDIQEAKTILIQQVRMVPGTFVLFHPTTKFSDFSKVKQTLEMVLRDYTCLTEGTVIPLESLAKGMMLKIVETKPKTPVHIVDVDLAIEFTEVLQEEKIEHREIVLDQTTEGRVEKDENGWFVIKLNEIPKKALLVDLRASVNSASLRNLLKDLTPDVDLYVGLKPYPSKSNYKWNSQRFGVNQVEIPVSEIPEKEPVIYIAVYGRSTSVFSLTVRVSDPLKIGNMLRGTSGISVNEDDAPVGKRKCENCGKFVPDGFMFNRHEMHCKRTTWRCDHADCRKRVPVKAKMKHIQLFHALMKCAMCGEELEGEIAMTRHEQHTCIERMVNCPICDLRVKQKELVDHTQICGSRTELCPFCKQFIPLLQIKDHCMERHDKEWHPSVMPTEEAIDVPMETENESKVNTGVKVSPRPVIDWESKINSGVKVSPRPDIDWKSKIDTLQDRPLTNPRKLPRKWVCIKCNNLNTGIASLCWSCKAPRRVKRERQPERKAAKTLEDTLKEKLYGDKSRKKINSGKKTFYKHWVCSQCNRMNPSTSLVCQYCKRSKNESLKNKVRVPTVPEALAEWECPKCSLHNKPNSLSCVVCGYKNQEQKQRFLALRVSRLQHS